MRPRLLKPLSISPWHPDNLNCLIHLSACCGSASAIGEPPAGALFGRIDPSKGYEPGNIHWSTYLEQNRNRRTVRGRPEMAAEIREVYKPEMARRTGITAAALADEFGVSTAEVAIVFTLTLWMRLVGAVASG